MGVFAILTAAFVLNQVLGPGLCAQTTQWTRIETDPDSTPIGREAHNMVYDERRGVVVMHGGLRAHRTYALSDTWEWNGATWTLVSTNGPALCNFGMAYDASRGVTVLYGGRIASGIVVDYVNKSDTWEWDGRSWTKIDTGQGDPLVTPAMAYDPRRQKVIRHGGLSDHSTFDHDKTWEWDGTNWTQISDGWLHVAGRMVYDKIREQMLLFGGASTSLSDLRRELRRFNGVRWDRIAAPGSAPAGRIFTAFAFDSYRGVGVLYGGATAPGNPSLKDTWEWDGAQWTKLDVPRNAAHPGARAFHAMAYDSKRRKVVVFGGSRSVHVEPYLNDTWEYALVPLEIEEITPQADGTIELRWRGEAPPYQLQSRSDLSGGPWQNEGEPMNGLTDAIQIGAAAKFFRIVSRLDLAPASGAP